MTQCSQLNLIDIVARSSANEQQTDGSPTCECTRETLGCSIHPNTPDAWIASMRDFLARISQSPELVQASMEIEAGCGPRSSGLLAYYDPGNFSLKIAQQSLLGDLAESYLTLPRWGTMQNGSVYPLPESVRPTDGTGGGALPTLTATEYGSCQGGAMGREGQKNRPSLQTMARNGILPTLTVYGNYNRAGVSATSGNGLATVIGGNLSPMWSEWFMGFPMGFTELKD